LGGLRRWLSTRILRAGAAALPVALLFPAPDLQRPDPEALPPLDAPAPLPTEPPLPADTPLPPDELLWPEF
jgi:hypothetical protein